MAGEMLRRGLRRGLLGGHRGWQAVLVLAAFWRLGRRLLRPGPGPVVHSQRLTVGQGLLIRHLPAEQAAPGGNPDHRG